MLSQPLIRNNFCITPFDEANHCVEKTAKSGRFQKVCKTAAASAASFCSILQPNYFAGQGHADTAAAIHEALEKSLLIVVHTLSQCCTHTVVSRNTKQTDSRDWKKFIFLYKLICGACCSVAINPRTKGHFSLKLTSSRNALQQWHCSAA